MIRPQNRRLPAALLAVCAALVCSAGVGYAGSGVGTATSDGDPLDFKLFADVIGSQRSPSKGQAAGADAALPGGPATCAEAGSAQDPNVQKPQGKRARKPSQDPKQDVPADQRRSPAGDKSSQDQKGADEGKRPNPKESTRQKAPDRMSAAERWTQAQLQFVADEIAAEIEQISGMRFCSPVEVQLADKAFLAARLRSEWIASESPYFNKVNELRAKLLGMIPPDMDLRGVWDDLIDEQVTSFFDGGLGRLYLLGALNSGLTRLVLARELSGALLAQHHDIESLMATAKTSDERFALDALNVGSAGAIAAEWRMRHRSEMDLKAMQMGFLQRDFAALKNTPPFIWRPQIAMSTRGNAFLCRSSVVSAMLGSARLGDIKRGYANPPLSSEQILHPVKYWKESRRDDPEPIEVDTSGLGEGWEVLDRDTLGELYLAILTEPFEARRDLVARSESGKVRERYTSRVTDGWSGDTCLLLERNGGFLLVLQTRWDEVTDAAQFFGGLSEIQLDLKMRLSELSGFEGAPHDCTVSLNEDARSVTLATWIDISKRDVEHALRDLRFK